MSEAISFGKIVKERRRLRDLTQAELAHRVACATITVRRIEADSLRPSVEVAERLAQALRVPDGELSAFVRLARTASMVERQPTPLPTPQPAPEEVGERDLTGRAVRGYELRERLGKGAYGIIYRAIQPTVEREVAVKIILPKYADDPEFVQRFEAEARLVARLEHPYIVPLYDFWREPGGAFLVMRLMGGGNLQTLLEQGSLDGALTRRLMRQLCSAMAYAHRCGVVHRDVKPANILLDVESNGYLADFGIARWSEVAAAADPPTTGPARAEPEYTPPERMRNEPYGRQSDIYGLGAVLYRMLTGSKTPRANDAGPNVSSSISVQGVPPSLEAVLQTAMAEEPSARYADPSDLLAAFEQATAPESSAASANVTVQPLEPVNPYKGLRFFTEADAPDFFGREGLVQDLLRAMAATHDLARFLAVIGPSGCGKSSVLRAGLLPAIRRGGLPESQTWYLVDMTPGADPVAELAHVLQSVSVATQDELAEVLRADVRGLARIGEHILTENRDVQLVLIIDQFEEVFTLVPDEERRKHFIDLIITAVLEADCRVRVVIALRADFLNRVLGYLDFGEMVRRCSQFVLPLSPDEIESAIVQPAHRQGLTLERDLPAIIAGDIGEQAGALPMLQFALTELYERREGTRLTLAAYRDTGGVPGALARRADRLYQELSASGHAAVRQLFFRLTTLGVGTDDTRRRVQLSELLSVKIDGAQVDGDTMLAVIELFGRYRLLTFDHDPITRGPTVEVAHEALLGEWTRLRGWLDEVRDDIGLQRRLAGAASEWTASGGEAGFLLRGGSARSICRMGRTGQRCPDR